MSRRRTLWILGLASLALFAVLAVLDLRMREAGGYGIVAFELATTTEKSAEIAAAWGEKGQDAARLSLILDFPFLVLYGAFLFVAARAVGSRIGPPAAIIAAVCDAVEDVFLLTIVEGPPDGSAAPLLAAVFAALKFAALIAAVCAVLLGALRSRSATARQG